MIIKLIDFYRKARKCWWCGKARFGLS